ncbi:hypothetical protein MLP_46790 [Microlunatus phosphovorus NM-1]|uniref:Uncharacterized protein n=1 Tax=Microlunatus phosphovorus (strain ATCC 700054 / DSM 10555 / JCM 9379 / NBRC 101784 / NCIMB 13414 / VKM Ac-1990 / NM-1) TaxID=1032480 RepID=F5XEE5_MICPN|nr:hypothetical protein MLP_46790 [Microlunatus phosphovorus NM-1]
MHSPCQSAKHGVSTLALRVLPHQAVSPRVAATRQRRTGVRRGHRSGRPRNLSIPPCGDIPRSREDSRRTCRN